jgi:oligosaccharyl transferase complex subunit OST4
MIADDELYRLAVFLGSAAMLLIVLYHFLEVNAVEEPAEGEKSQTSSSLTDAKVATIVR